MIVPRTITVQPTWFKFTKTFKGERVINIKAATIGANLDAATTGELIIYALISKMV